MDKLTTAERKSDRELVIRRTFDAPARIVFEAWTRPELFKRWWVPKSLGMSLLSCEMDVRVGGKYRLVFAHEGSEAAFYGTYLEVTPHSRLVWTNEEGGGSGPVTTLALEEKGGKTLLVLSELHPSKKSLDENLGVVEGLRETFGQLEELLATLGTREHTKSATLNPTELQVALEGETDIVIRRDFAQPPDRVWRGLTEPALIRRWMGPGDSMKRCEMDLRPGGSFHWEWEEFFFSGPILAVDAPHHMTHVEHFNGDTSSGPTITTDLAAHGGGTRMIQVMRYANHEARAAAIANGFTDGLDEVYGRLATLLTGE